jgi:ketosteroid isomerase-like protein
MTMKKNILLQVVLVILFSVTINSLSAQKTSEKVKNEITETLKIWNTACKSAKLDQVMSMLDITDGLMVVGSADGEINKGKDEVKAWIGQIFGVAGFSWEMNRIDIDCNGNTAWVFVDGKMIVDFHKGGQKVTPYRFTGIMVKKKGAWKWRLFDGSVPQQE